jgi:gluconate 2-dehydrogenase gamma chain
MDTVLADDRDEELALLRQGLSDLQQSLQADYGQNSFRMLTEAQQDSALAAIEDSAFFGTLHFLTIAGMFSLPEYGGNRDLVGYQLIGFENQHAWAPPFGYYDAEYNGGGQ